MPFCMCLAALAKILARAKINVLRKPKNIARDKKILEPSNGRLEGSKIFLEGSKILRARAYNFLGAVSLLVSGFELFVLGCGFIGF